MRTLLLLLLPGCGEVGLSSLPEHTVQSAAGRDVTSAELDRRLYAVAPEDLVVAEPSGLEAFKAEILDRDLLVWVESVGSTDITLDVTLAAADGDQDPCQRVLQLPDGAWDNPSFLVGPGELQASFSGHDASFQSLELSGRFDGDGEGWEGDLAAVLDARELEPALPEVDDVCRLVEQLGGACNACEDGALSCFDLRLEELRGERIDADFDPTPVCD